MKKTLLLTLLLGLSASVWAQDDLESLLAQQPEGPQVVKSVFKATRLINGHTNETVPNHHLDFRIAHRFGYLNSGAYNAFGLDNATVRLSLEYGITDRLMVGLGRSSYNKWYDGFAKYKLVEQKSGGGSPLGVTVFTNAAYSDLIVTLPNPSEKLELADKMTYTAQVLLTRKFSERFSALLAPTMVHRNLVATEKDENSVYALGVGGRFKLSKRVSFNAEWFAQAPGENAKRNKNAFALGFDIETGGHVFQLHCTNAIAMIEQGFIATTQGDWGNGDIQFGFNISRMFSLQKNR